MKYILFLLTWCVPTLMVAQNTTNSPTSMFGIGEVTTGDGGQYAGMGGVGIALRSNSFLNLTNPAALTEIDSLKFTIEAGVMGAYKKYTQSGIGNNSTVGNLNNLAVGFRILPRWYGALSISPISSVGYAITLDQQVEGTNGGIISSYFEGDGGLSRINLSNAFLIGKNLSLGANLSYITGTITQTETQGSATREETSRKTACYADLGMQYKYNLNKNNAFILGATYGFKQQLSQKNELSVSSTSDDTTIDKSEHSVKQYMPQFIGIGLSYNTPKWTFSGDYKWIQWDKMESSQSIVSYANQNLLKLGLAYTLGNPYRTPIKLMLGAGTSNSYVVIKKNEPQNYYISTGAAFTLKNKNIFSFGAKYSDQTKVNTGMPREQSLSFYLNISFSERAYRGKLQ
ncbi:hypothetical protein [Bacteroides graminisolvens]|uniref:hypothetical protein n=1 Tax=Bacteroides graminisolvens TaxID=477666 RepID=UPI000E8C77A9|nr:hypothetical protein [Bacteroides sp.]MCD8474989.1 hypothetical protein [Bacteroides graminisolvens]MCD8555632.1 hypothetical protein [Bacteroides graminisolvens]MCD8572820.1 hypothetical protein [Bacteroides graminisolvens]HAZ58327.1 hypothetical protein [Bacteroides graminisolvens]